jgi:hypothetical protein
MDMTYVSGRSFGSNTTGYKDEGDGLWHVVVTMVEILTFPNGLERSETIEGRAENVSFHEAHKSAMRDVLQLLQDLVYSKGFDSLIEGMDYERSLQESDDPKIEANEDSTPE